MELSQQEEWEDFTGREELLIWQWERWWNTLENRSEMKYDLSGSKHTGRNGEKEYVGGNPPSFLTELLNSQSFLSSGNQSVHFKIIINW